MKIPLGMLGGYVYIGIVRIRCVGGFVWGGSGCGALRRLPLAVGTPVSGDSVVSSEPGWV